MQKKIKYTIAIFTILTLIISLYITNSFGNILFATNTSTKKESSTSTNTANSGGDMVDLLARLINGEARGEPYEGQVAVGAVILNRVKSPAFPNTIPAVIYQKGQFSSVTDGQFDKAIDKDSTVYQAAKEALSGSDPSNGALYFFAPSKTKSKWLFSLKTVATIGGHRFCAGE